MHFSWAVMFGSLRFQNIEDFVSFVYMLDCSVQGKEGCNIACIE